MTSFEAICAGGVATSLGYLGYAQWCFSRWAAAPPAEAGRPGEPITFFRPLKGGVPGLRAKLEAMARALRAEDQLLIGVDPASPEAVLGGEIRAAFPEREIVVVPCATGPGASGNPKVAKLIQMAPLARHEHWVVADGEAWLDAEWVEGWRAEWAACGAAVLTAGYRIEAAQNWPQRLDAAGLLVTLWPGLAVLHAARALRFTLGACVALRRADLTRVGGWAAFGDVLAEDNRLGAALVATGRRIQLSRQVVALQSDPLDWRAWWRHQRRVAVTYRVGNPWGYAGSVVTMGEMWALLLVASGAWWGLALFFGVWAVRTAGALRMARTLAFSLPGLALAVLGASLAGSVCWAASWGTRTVWWSGRRWRVSFRGGLRGI